MSEGEVSLYREGKGRSYTHNPTTRKKRAGAIQRVGREERGTEGGEKKKRAPKNGKLWRGSIAALRIEEKRDLAYLERKRTSAAVGPAGKEER